MLLKNTSTLNLFDEGGEIYWNKKSNWVVNGASYCFYDGGVWLCAILLILNANEIKEGRCCILKYACSCACGLYNENSNIYAYKELESYFNYNEKRKNALLFPF